MHSHLLKSLVVRRSEQQDVTLAADTQHASGSGQLHLVQQLSVGDGVVGVVSRQRPQRVAHWRVLRHEQDDGGAVVELRGVVVDVRYIHLPVQRIIHATFRSCVAVVVVVVVLVLVVVVVVVVVVAAALAAVPVVAVAAVAVVVVVAVVLTVS